jgi:hypothetical protein
MSETMLPSRIDDAQVCRVAGVCGQRAREDFGFAREGSISFARCAAYGFDTSTHVRHVVKRRVGHMSTEDPA